MDEDAIADMIAFGASEAAPYLYPEADQELLRQAYCEGAAQGARALIRWQDDNASPKPVISGDAASGGER